MTKLMTKQDMKVSLDNPLISQINCSDKIIKGVYITYNICETCNLDCLFCCINDKYHGTKAISTFNSDMILDQIHKEYGISTIFIMANEPTTQPDLSNHIIRYAIKNNIEIKIVTNGFAPISVYQRMLSDINPSDIDKITVSLDSMDEKVHNTIRNNLKSFSNAIRTIQFLKDNNYNIRVQMTICDINYDTIVDSVRELNEKYDIHNFAFHCMSVSDRGKRNGLNHINPFKWRKLVRELFNLKKELNHIEEYNVPIIAMTENELLRLYFGNDEKLLKDFLERKPLRLCPAINGNNIYLKANDGESIISRCQILFDNIGNYSFHYDYQNHRFVENKINPDIDVITESNTLCPVIFTELNSSKDYEEDENGNELYYVCRVLLADEEDLDY